MIQSTKLDILDRLSRIARLGMDVVHLWVVQIVYMVDGH